MRKARADAGPDQMLLRNIDPVRVLRDKAPEEIKAALSVCFDSIRPRYITGAGCEVVRDTPHQNLQAMIDFAREHHL